jgi:hypothetical protein
MNTFMGAECTAALGGCAFSVYPIQPNTQLRSRKLIL